MKQLSKVEPMVPTSMEQFVAGMTITANTYPLKQSGTATLHCGGFIPCVISEERSTPLEMSGTRGDNMSK